MFCMNCGNQIADGNRFCSKCGTAVKPLPVQPAQPVQPELAAYEQVIAPQAMPEQPMYQVPDRPAYEELSWNGFYKRFVGKGAVITTIVICFVTALASLGLGMAQEAPAFWLDVAVYLAAGIGLLASKHWIFSLIVSVYGGIASLIAIGTTGTPSGAFAVFTGIMCTITLIKARKAYAAYRTDHIVPDKI